MITGGNNAAPSFQHSWNCVTLDRLCFLVLAVAMVSISAVLLCVLLRRMFRCNNSNYFFWSVYYWSYQVPDLRGEHIAFCLLEAQVNSLCVLVLEFASSFPATDRLTSNIASNTRAWHV